MENQTSEANKCRLKIAQYSADLERFPVAIEIYENIAKSQVDSNLLKYSAKGNLLNAGLCRLNGKQSLLSYCMSYEDNSSEMLSESQCTYYCCGHRQPLSHGSVCFDLCMPGVSIEQIAIHEHRPIHEHCH